MAAQSAAEVVDVNAAVVETRTVPQGFTSLLAFDPSQSIEANVEAMTASLSDVTSGSVTLAVRDTTIDGLEIHENDILGMVDGKILVSTPDMDQALLDTFDKMIDEDSEIVMIYVGEEVIKTKLKHLRKNWKRLTKILKLKSSKETNQFIHTSLVLNNIEIII